MDSNILPFINSQNGVILTDNQLEFLNDGYFSSCEKLTYLGLKNAFTPTAKLSREFLTSILSTLQLLKLTLPPDLSLDLSASRSLSRLIWLDLESAAGLDINNEYPRLTKQAFKESFAHMQDLYHLSLSYFDIGSIDREMFEQFHRLESLKLRHNRIAHIHSETFKNYR